MKRLTLLALAFGLAACAKRNSHSCHSDNDCNSGEVCFANGCGDPGTDIAVEVSINPGAGQQPQDFLLSTVHPVENFSLAGSSMLQGRIDRPTGSPYAGPVALHVVGQSTLIPGISRSYDGTAVGGGGYSIAVGTGRYALTVVPTDVSIPQAVYSGVDIAPAALVNLDVSFPAANSLTRLQGTLLRSQPSDPVPVAMQIQVFDSTGTTPLSQPTPVDPSGAFSVMAQLSSESSSFLIQATPQDSTAWVPSKTFPIPNAAAPLQLEMGNYGDPVNVTGRITSARGDPVAGAAVYIIGTVVGGGTFRSPVVQTDGSGVFTVRSLVGQAHGSFVLWAVPPANSPAGLFHGAADVFGATSLGDLACPNKVSVQGVVHRPDGSPFAEVKVTAIPINPAAGQPLPSNDSETTSDSGGRFEMGLDPAIYQLDFTTNESLPRLSRYVTVAPDPTGAGLNLQSFDFSKGRTVTGQIRASPGQRNQKPQTLAPYASVRFFRVPVSGDDNISVLLAEGAANANGEYSVVLPTR